MKHYKIIYIVLSLVTSFSSSSIFGQNEYVSVPSANAGATAKSSEIPVTTSSGTAQISIPIVTLQEFDNLIPIALNHVTGGLRVTEIGSSVGTGWSLLFGGTITRSVRDLPDDLLTIYSNQPVGFIQYSENPNQFINSPHVDHTPDIYYFNILGVSGSFTLDKVGNVILTNEMDIVIERKEIGSGTNRVAIKYWRVLLPNGVEVFLGDYDAREGTEYSVSYDQKDVNKFEDDPNYCSNNGAQYPCINNPEFKSTWNIIKCISPQLHEANYHYILERYVEYSLPVDLRPLKSPCEHSEEYSPNEDIVYQEIYPCRLLAIEGEYYKLELNYGDVRSDVDILTKYSDFLKPTVQPKILSGMTYSGKKEDNWTCLKKWSFTHTYEDVSSDGFNYPTDWINGLDSKDYFDLKRLFLNKVIEQSCDESISYETNISYYNLDKLTRRLSHAQDYWGFNNGMRSNETLIPQITLDDNCFQSIDCRVSKWSKYANRESDPDFAKAGSVSQIEFPNGSATSIEYEGNDVRVREYVLEDTQDWPIGICSVQSGTCVNCDGLTFGQEVTITEIPFEPDAFHSLVLNLSLLSKSNGTGTVEIFSRPSDGSTNWGHITTIALEADQLITCPLGGYIFIGAEFQQYYYNSDFRNLLLFGWEAGETYDIKFVLSEGIKLTGKFNQELYVPSIINKQVGGLRVKRLITDELVQEYSYTTETDLEITPENNLVLFDIDLCNDAHCNPSAPGGGNPPTCNGKSVDHAIHIFIPCESETHLNVTYTQSTGCAQSWLQVSFAWKESFTGSTLDSIVLTSYATTGDWDLLTEDLEYLGIERGKTYDFSFRILQGHFGKATAWLQCEVPSVTYTPIGNKISSGELIVPPSILSYAGYINSGIKFKDDCFDGDLYMLSTYPQSQFHSSSGGIILYKSVSESYFQGDQYFGKKVSYYNDDKFLSEEPRYSKYNGLLALQPEYPAIQEKRRPPQYGLLKQINVYDASNLLEVSESYEYLIKSKWLDIWYYDIQLKCDDFPIGFSSYDEMPSHTILPLRTTKNELNIETVTSYKYRSDFAHLNPIRTITYVTGHTDTIVTETKYATDLDDQNMIERNMVSIPLETILDKNLGGGTKIEYTVSGGRILPSKFKRRLNNGDWRLIKEINYSGSTGLPTTIWEIGGGGVTSCDWQDGLLIETQFANRTNTYSYYPTRLLSSMIDYQGISSSYSYDPMLRLGTHERNNGHQTSTYTYFMHNPDEENRINSKTTFQNDGSPSCDLPVWESDEITDIVNRSFSNVKKSFTYSGSDYTTGIQKGIFGETILSCNPNKGGCDEYEYTLSPIRRLKRITPAGASRSILYQISSNENSVSLGSIDYPSNTLVKTSITDENGIKTEQYVNLRGQTVMTCRDPEGLNLKTHYLFNKRGDIDITYPPGSASDGDIVNFKYTYQNDGLLETKIIPDEGSYTYTYNAREQVESVLKPNGYITEYFYHETYPDFLLGIEENDVVVKSITAYENDYALGWIGTVDVRADNGTMLSTICTSRDDLGRVTSETREYLDGVSEYSYTYDDADNLRFLARNHTGPDPEQEDISYTYYYHMPKGVRIDEVKLKLGGILSLSKYAYDDNDWLISDQVGDGLHTISYAYTPRGWLQEINSVEAPPPGPLEHCDEVESNDTPALPTPFPNCKLVGDEYLLRILFNCNQLQHSDSTNINIIMQSAGGVNVNEIIPLNGSSGLETDYPDIYEILLSSEDLTGISGILQSLFANCINSPAGSIKGEFDLQSISNQILNQINEEESSGALFGLRLHYDHANAHLEAPAQYNGNIAWMEWQVAGEHYQTYGFQYDGANRLTQGIYEAKYTKCKKTPADYDVSFGYDARGNITQQARNGFLGISNSGVPEYGPIDRLSYNYNGANQLGSVSESSNQNIGFKGSQSTYQYHYGRMDLEQGARAASVDYNFLNQPTLIKKSGANAVKNIWDADGTLQKQILYDQSGNEIHQRLYHAGIEYLDDKIQAINHDEGRYVFEYEQDGSFKRSYHEFVISDNLRNTRVRFADFNGDKKVNVHDEGPGQEKEILGSFHYYPYGLQMAGIFHSQEATECRYQYNGIEHISHKDLDLDLATWRTHDPWISRWWQIDPKAEDFYGISPYNSMAANPIVYCDPQGANPVLAIIGVVLAGGTLNVVSNWGYIDGFNEGLSYFMNGVAGYGTGLANPWAGAVLLASSNLATRANFGDLKLETPSDYISAATSAVADGLGPYSLGTMTTWTQFNPGTTRLTPAEIDELLKIPGTEATVSASGGVGARGIISEVIETGESQLSQVAAKSGTNLGSRLVTTADNVVYDLKSTIDRINSGGKFPHRNDGTFFQNREGLLPKQNFGYYKEFVHPTPGVNGPGPMRVITGQGGEMWFSPDHYKTFIPIR